MRVEATLPNGITGKMCSCGKKEKEMESRSLFSWRGGRSSLWKYKIWLPLLFTLWDKAAGRAVVALAPDWRSGWGSVSDVRACDWAD